MRVGEVIVVVSVSSSLLSAGAFVRSFVCVWIAKARFLFCSGGFFVWRGAAIRAGRLG